MVPRVPVSVMEKVLTLFLLFLSCFIWNYFEQWIWGRVTDLRIGENPLLLQD
jgi:hypothetical protein